MSQYLVAKKFKRIGCAAIETSKLEDTLITLNALELSYYGTGIQFVIISRPKAYPEYKPYEIVNDERSFIKSVTRLRDLPNNID